MFWQTKTAQSGDDFSLRVVGKPVRSYGRYASIPVVKVVLRLRGEPVAVAPSGRWAVALILEPVPNVSAGRAIARTGRLFDFCVKDNG